MGTSFDYSKISIQALSRSKKILSDALNIARAFPNDDGVHRDWRGLLHYIGGHKEYISRTDPDPMKKVLEIWQSSKELVKTYNVECLLKYLEQLNRWDILDDIKEILDEDIKFYINNRHDVHNEVKYIDEDSALTLSDEHYDAYILYHDENEGDGIRVLRELESRNLRCCATDRDLLTSEFKHEAITRLISKRCTKLVILVTQAFLQSRLFTYIRIHTQALGIEKDTNKLIPLRFDNCVLPETLKFYNMIDFTKNDVYNNRWDRIYYSIRPKVPEIKNEQITACINNLEIVDNKISETINSRPLLDVAGSVLHGSSTSVDEINRNISSSNSINFTVNNQQTVNIDNNECQRDDKMSKIKSKRKKEKKPMWKKIKKALLV